MSSARSVACTNATWRRPPARWRSSAWATPRSRQSASARRRAQPAALAGGAAPGGGRRRRRLAVLRRSAVRAVPQHRGGGAQASGGAVGGSSGGGLRRLLRGPPCRGGRAAPEGSVVVLTFDGKAASRGPARGDRKAPTATPFKRLKPGEKHSKRMATVAAVDTTAPFVRSPEEFLETLMPDRQRRRPGSCGLARSRPWRNGSRRASNGSRGKWWRTLRWKQSVTTRAGQALDRARRSRRDADQPYGSGAPPRTAWTPTVVLDIIHLPQAAPLSQVYQP